jgi:hypothetical protein
MVEYVYKFKSDPTIAGSRIKPKSIVDKPDSKADEPSFMDTFYDSLSSFFSSEEDAKRALSPKEEGSKAGEKDIYDAYESAMENRRMREAMGITQSLVEGGGEAYRKEPPEGTITRPVARPDELVTDTAKDVEESAPVTAETESAGLMSKPLTDDDMGLPDIRSSTEDDISLNKAFVKKMATSEGTTDHVDSLGIPTLGYGVLPATARAYGFDPDSAKYSDRKVLAEDVYDAMYKDANTEYPDVFSNLDESQKIGTLSLYINLGKLPTGVVNALSRDVPDFDAAKDSLASVVLGSPRDKNKKRKKTKDNKVIYTSNKGLSKRRAGEYNTLMEGQAGFKPVHTVSVEGTTQNPVFVWKDSDNNEIHRYTPSITGDDKVYQGLDSSSTMNDVRVD